MPVWAGWACQASKQAGTEAGQCGQFSTGRCRRVQELAWCDREGRCRRAGGQAGKWAGKLSFFTACLPLAACWAAPARLVQPLPPPSRGSAYPARSRGWCDVLQNDWEALQCEHEGACCQKTAYWQPLAWRRSDAMALCGCLSTGALPCCPPLCACAHTAFASSLYFHAALHLPLQSGGARWQGRMEGHQQLPAGALCPQLDEAGRLAPKRRGGSTY